MTKQARVVTLRKKGLTYREIAKKVKVSTGSVSVMLRRAQMTNRHFKKHKNGQSAYKAVIADVLRQGKELRAKAETLLSLSNGKLQLAEVLKAAHRASLN